MVIRDLTLRSATSFGSFHLIRLLFDEYLFYLVEAKLASEQNVTKIAALYSSHRHHGKSASENNNIVIEKSLNNNNKDSEGKCNDLQVCFTNSGICSQHLKLKNAISLKK